MGSKVSSVLKKVEGDRKRKDFRKAIDRLADAVDKEPDLMLYQELIDVCMEAGDARLAVKFFKKAQAKVPEHYEDLWAFCKEKVRTYNDTVLCKFLLELAIKKRNLPGAEEVLDNLKDHTAGELLKRTRTKKQTLSAAMSGGMAFKGELAVNNLAEAMLCIRSKRFQEAAQAFIRVLEEKPVEHEILTPFLAELEMKYPQKGGLTYALGCSYLTGEKYDKALIKLVQGVSHCPAFADDAVGKLGTLEEGPDVTADEIRLRLAKVYIIKEDHHHAAEQISSVLERGGARDVLELLEPHLHVIGDTLVLDYLYIEAALLASNPQRALGHVQKVYAVERHRRDLLAWLDTKSQERFMPVPMLQYYGQIAIEQNMYEKAVEILRELLAHSPHETPAVKELIAGHLGNEAIRAFHAELEGTDGRQKKPGGFEIEHFQRTQFSIGSEKGPPPAAAEAPAAPKPPPADVETNAAADEPRPPAEADSAAPESAKEPLASDPARPERPEDPAAPDSPPPGPKKDAIPMKEESSAFVGMPAADAEPPPRSPDEMVFERERTMPPESGAGDQPPPAGESAAEGGAETTAPGVILLGPDPAAEGAAATDPAPPRPESRPPVASPDPPPSQGKAPASSGPVPPEETLPAGDPAAPADPPVSRPKGEGPGTPPDPAPPRSERPEDFDAALAAFEKGPKEKARRFELIAMAIKAGKLAQAKKLLAFKPVTIAEDIQRTYHLAEYYLAADSPLSALVALKTVHLSGLSKEERRRFLIKIAYCYQSLNRFDAAHGVYLRIMSEDPEFSEVEEMAKKNYEKYVKGLAGGAPVLEKITSL